MFYFDGGNNVHAFKENDKTVKLNEENNTLAEL
jgi:hypothetical protein